MKDRLKEVRKSLGLTQQEFADRMGIKRDSIANCEAGRTEPSSATVSLICRTFGVDEVWLRTGQGEMFKPRSREDEIAAFFGDLLSGEAPGFQRDLIAVLASLPSKHWAGLEAVFRGLLEMEQANEKGPAEGQGQEQE